jgi:ferric-dicitrate binding protein FerR (iron transport regulator)
MRLSWNEGYMEFDGVRLSEVVDQFNLNNRVQIVIVDPALAGLRISGRFNAGDAYGFATTLHRGFGIRVRVVKDRSGHERLVFGERERKVAEARVPLSR